MTKFIKTGILIVVLVVPVFIFLYLKFFSKNYYKLPVFYPIDSVATNSGYRVTQAHQIPKFSFLNQDSVMVNSEQFNGKILVVDFFFTRCQTICPKMTRQLQKVQDEFIKEKDIQLLSFSVDPNFDTPSVLSKHISDKAVDKTRWFFLTGSKDTLYTLAQRGFFLTAMEDEEHPIDFIHSDKVVLVDKNRWIRGYYNGTDKKDIERLIAEIKVLKQIELNEQSK